MIKKYKNLKEALIDDSIISTEPILKIYDFNDDVGGNEKPLPELLNDKQTAEYLNISRATLWRNHARGLIPKAHRIGKGSSRWSRQELKEWIDAGMPDRNTWELLNAQKKED